MGIDNDILKQFGFESDKELQRFLENVDNLEIPKSHLNKNEAWSKLESSIKSEKPEKSRILKFNFTPILLIAASIALIIGLWIGFEKWNYTEFNTSAGKTLAMELPDGSLVILNAESQVSWNKFRWKSSRVVYLKGEALFKVNKGSKFEVHTSQNTVSVMGTKFNVFSRTGYFEVKCYEGKVAVDIKGASPIILTRGKAVKKESANSATESFEIQESDSSSWTKGEFYYNNASLNLVLDEISRQFNVRINYQATDRRYSGFFKNTSLDSALMNVCMPLGLNFNINGDSVVIR
jgi:ferric-dicitrate binding protein FerR (iron transport regulator)